MVSLVTEWIFLWGFPAALLVILLVRFSVGNRENNRRHRVLGLVGEVAFAMVGFTAFYWSAVGLLSLKYTIRAG